MDSTVYPDPHVPFHRWMKEHLSISLASTVVNEPTSSSLSSMVTESVSTVDDFYPLPSWMNFTNAVQSYLSPSSSEAYIGQCNTWYTTADIESFFGSALTTYVPSSLSPVYYRCDNSSSLSFSSLSLSVTTKDTDNISDLSSELPASPVSSSSLLSLRSDLSAMMNELAFIVGENNTGGSSTPWNSNPVVDTEYYLRLLIVHGIQPLLPRHRNNNTTKYTNSTVVKSFIKDHTIFDLPFLPLQETMKKEKRNNNKDEEEEIKGKVAVASNVGITTVALPPQSSFSSSIFSFTSNLSSSTSAASPSSSACSAASSSSSECSATSYSSSACSATSSSVNFSHSYSLNHHHHHQHHHSFEALTLRKLGPIMVNTLIPSNGSRTSMLNRYKYIFTKLDEYKNTMEEYKQHLTNLSSPRIEPNPYTESVVPSVSITNGTDTGSSSLLSSLPYTMSSGSCNSITTSPTVMENMSPSAAVNDGGNFIKKNIINPESSPSSVNSTNSNVRRSERIRNQIKATATDNDDNSTYNGRRNTFTTPLLSRRGATGGDTSDGHRTGTKTSTSSGKRISPKDPWYEKMNQYLPIIKHIQASLVPYLNPLSGTSCIRSLERGGTLTNGSARVLVLNFYRTCITLSSPVKRTVLSDPVDTATPTSTSSVSLPYDWEYTYSDLPVVLHRYFEAGYRIVILEDYSTAEQIEQEKYRDQKSNVFKSLSKEDKVNLPDDNRNIQHTGGDPSSGATMQKYSPPEVILRLCLRIEQFIYQLCLPVQVFLNIPSIVNKKYSNDNSFYTKPHPGIWFMFNWYMNNKVSIDYSMSLYVTRGPSLVAKEKEMVVLSKDERVLMSNDSFVFSSDYSNNPFITLNDLYFTMNCNLPCTRDTVFFDRKKKKEEMKGKEETEDNHREEETEDNHREEETEDIHRAEKKHLFTNTIIPEEGLLRSVGESRELAWMVNPVQEYCRRISQHIALSNGGVDHRYGLPYYVPWPLVQVFRQRQKRNRVLYDHNGNPDGQFKGIDVRCSEPENTNTAVDSQSNQNTEIDVMCSEPENTNTAVDFQLNGVPKIEWNNDDDEDEKIGKTNNATIENRGHGKTKTRTTPFSPSIARLHDKNTISNSDTESNDEAAKPRISVTIHNSSLIPNACFDGDDINDPENDDEKNLKIFLHERENTSRGLPERALFVLIGIPGSGKSSIARKYFTPSSFSTSLTTTTMVKSTTVVPKYVRINMDILRNQNEAIDLATFLLDPKRNTTNKNDCSVGIDNQGNIQWLSNGKDKGNMINKNDEHNSKNGITCSTITKNGSATIIITDENGSNGITSSDAELSVLSINQPSIDSLDVDENTKRTVDDSSSPDVSTNEPLSFVTPTTGLLTPLDPSAFPYSILIDGTHIDIRSRQGWLQLAKIYKLPIYGIYIDVPLYLSIHQSKVRTANPLMNDDRIDYQRKIPSRIIYDMYQRLEPPISRSQGNISDDPGRKNNHHGSTVDAKIKMKKTKGTTKNEEWDRLFVLRRGQHTCKDTTEDGREEMNDSSSKSTGTKGDDQWYCWTCWFLDRLRESMM